jgi:hypothetical protein
LLQARLRRAQILGDGFQHLLGMIAQTGSVQRCGSRHQ